MKAQLIILDFGSQYTQLIGRKVRDLGVYCEIWPFDKYEEAMDSAKAIILSGSPYSSMDQTGPRIKLDNRPQPTLGICYGAQITAMQHGGQVSNDGHREYGSATLRVTKTNDLLGSKVDGSQIWMSHGDAIVELPDQAELLATTDDIPVAAYRMILGDRPFYGVQFHPEVSHSEEGLQILSNFLFGVAGLTKDWSPSHFISECVASIEDQIGADDHVLMALSGGVDSTVAARLIQQAVGDRLHCVFVDNGLLRLNEYEEVLDIYDRLGLNVQGIDAKQLFYKELSGVTDPEQKRKIIGRLFIEVFERAAKSVSNIKWLGQGTIYPDVIESVSFLGPSVTIKSHHNVGGLPEKLGLKIVEPLRTLFKDEVRRIGRELGVPDDILNRHPFPGPGLGIRVIGEVNESSIRLLQKADALYIQALRESGWYERVWQAGAILLPIHSVGVMGDERTYEQVVALRAVDSGDGMTAQWSPLPHELLAKISSRIINQVTGINRVVYDISTKPPSTIEWE